MSPWHVACRKGNLEIVKTFLKIEDLQINQQGKEVFSFFLFSLVWDIFDDLLKSIFVKKKRERQLCVRQLREVILTLLLYWWKEVLQSILEIKSVFSLLIFYCCQMKKNDSKIFFSKNCYSGRTPFTLHVNWEILKLFLSSPNMVLNFKLGTVMVLSWHVKGATWM